MCWDFVSENLRIALMSLIPEASLWLSFYNLKVLVLALRYRPHPTHFHLEAALEMIQKLK